MLAVSDTVQIVTIITGCVTTVALPLIAVYAAILNQRQKEAAVEVKEVARKQDVAADDVKEVKTALKESNVITVGKLEEIHRGVNGMNKIIEEAGFARGVKAELDKHPVGNTDLIEQIAEDVKAVTEEVKTVPAVTADAVVERLNAPEGK